MKKLIVAIVAIAGAAIGIGCSKNSDKSKNCKLTSLGSGTEIDMITYNGQGKIKSVKSASTNIDIAYQGDSVFIVQSDSTGPIQKTYVKVNADGLATGVRADNLVSKNTIRYAYQYSGTELAIAITTLPNNTSDVTQYFWTDHNLTSIVSNKDTSYISYYSDRAFQPGDYFYVTSLIQGYQTIRNKNLLKGYGSSAAFIYEFNTDGKISSMTYTAGTNTSSIDYGYDCN